MTIHDVEDQSVTLKSRVEEEIMAALWVKLFSLLHQTYNLLKYNTFFFSKELGFCILLAKKFKFKLITNQKSF